MGDLRATLEKLGLQAYTERFISEGFDSWDTLARITESDLNELGVKLGHRRKLQWAITECHRPVNGFSWNPSSAVGGRRDGMSRGGSNWGYRDERQSDNQSSTGRAKRKYRRHPKVVNDPTSTLRKDLLPPTYSSPIVGQPTLILPSATKPRLLDMREELRDHELSFAEMAKAVGEKWQILPPEEREQYERQAAAGKERYHAQIAEYKKTEEHAQYQQYLADFKAKQGPDNISPAVDQHGKKPKVKHETSGETQSSNDLSNASSTPPFSMSTSSPAKIHSTKHPNSNYMDSHPRYGPPTSRKDRSTSSNSQDSLDSPVDNPSRIPTSNRFGASMRARRVLPVPAAPSHEGHVRRDHSPPIVPHARHRPTSSSLEALLRAGELAREADVLVEEKR